MARSAYALVQMPLSSNFSVAFSVPQPFPFIFRSSFMLFRLFRSYFAPLFRSSCPLFNASSVIRQWGLPKHSFFLSIFPQRTRMIFRTLLFSGVFGGDSRHFWKVSVTCHRDYHRVNLKTYLTNISYFFPICFFGVLFFKGGIWECFGRCIFFVFFPKQLGCKGSS